MIVKSKDKMLIVYNAWQVEDGTKHFWHNGGAIFVEERNGVKIYNCNDGYPDEDFNDLIFKLEFNWSLHYKL